MLHVSVHLHKDSAQLLIGRDGALKWFHLKWSCTEHLYTATDVPYASSSGNYVDCLVTVTEKIQRIHFDKITTNLASVYHSFKGLFANKCHIALCHC